MSEIRVNFYRSSAIRPYAPRSVKNKLWFGLHDLVLGRGFTHCNIEIDGWLYQCDMQGCRFVPVSQFPFRPSFILHLDDASLSAEGAKPFDQRSEYTLFRGMLHGLGVKIPVATVTNCVQATCRLLGVQQECRTPFDLFLALTGGDYRGGTQNQSATAA